MKGAAAPLHARTQQQKKKKEWSAELFGQVGFNTLFPLRLKNLRQPRILANIIRNQLLSLFQTQNAELRVVVEVSTIF